MSAFHPKADIPAGWLAKVSLESRATSGSTVLTV
jgi:predicted RNA binding protein YcfA (HicA-like mRNA interferase family)